MRALALALLLVAAGASAADPIECPDGKVCHVPQSRFCEWCTVECADGSWQAAGTPCPVSTNELRNAEQDKRAEVPAREDAERTRKRNARQEARRLAAEREAARPFSGGRAPTKADVEQYLLRIANDPESVVLRRCTEAEHLGKDGWALSCNWRDRNELGDVVTKSTTFFGAHGSVNGHTD